VAHWLKYADYYQNDMRCVKYFDNVNERNEILGMCNDELIAISADMREHNIERKDKVYSAWKEVLEMSGS